jgi:hypothetical protein
LLQFVLDEDQLARLQKRAKLNRFFPSLASACFNGDPTMTTIDGFTGDCGDDDFRLTMMDNDLVSMF